MQNETVTIIFHDTIQPVKDQVGQVAKSQGLTLTQDETNPLVQTCSVTDPALARKFLDGLKHVKGISIKTAPFSANVTEVNQPVDPPASEHGAFRSGTKQ